MEELTRHHPPASEEDIVCIDVERLVDQACIGVMLHLLIEK
jgi:hypothetical protein